MLKYLALLLLLLPKQAQAAHIVSKEAFLDINTDRVTHVTGYIDEKSLFTFEKEFFETLHSVGPRLVIINSPGGDVGVGLQMVQLLEVEKAAGIKLICVVEDMASSMAFNLLTHCDVRLAKRHAHMVVHKIAVGGLGGPFIRLTARKLREIARNLDLADEQFRVENARAMHLSLADYDLFANAERNWSAAKLLKMGYLQGYF